MAIQYPNSIDTLLTIPKAVDLVTPVRARELNNLVDAALAIETELGTNPSGSYGTVADRLNAFDDLVGDELQASQIDVADPDGYFTATDVEGALKELITQVLFVTATADDIAITDPGSHFTGSNVEAALEELAEGAVAIGDPEDGSYADGLFTDLTPTTRLGVAIDRFNEFLASLVPDNAPALSSIGYSTTLGVAGKVSFGASNAIATYTNVSTTGGGSALDINGTFTSGSSTALRKGIYAALPAIDRTGFLADTVAADAGSPFPAFPAKSFGDANLGLLQLWVNGTKIHETDLTAFSSGSSVNGSGSGFINLSAATSVVFPNGDTFAERKYRTGEWKISSTETLRNGWNLINVIHTNGVFTRTSNYFEWVIDAVTTTTSYSAESLAVPTMSGSKGISGVTYYTSGVSQYSVTASNVHRNTYSSSASAVAHPGATNVSVSATALGSIAIQADTEVITNQAVTISASRLLGQILTVNTQVDRTVQTDGTSSGASTSAILMDAVVADSSATIEGLNDERYRVPSNRSLLTTTGFTADGAGLWDGYLSIVSGGAGYNDGLLVYGSSLYYPNNATIINSGNFSSIVIAPGGNPNYSAAAGTRTYLRYFYYSTPAQNFNINIVSSGVTFVAAATSLGTNNGNAYLEILAPNTTVNGSGTIQYKDAVTAYTTDGGIGCFASTYGATVPTNWGITLGAKSTSTSGSVIIARVTVGQGWTGSISSITVAAV